VRHYLFRLKNILKVNMVSVCQTYTANID